MFKKYFRLHNRYYGSDSFSNRFFSKAIFRLLEKRRQQLENVFNSHPVGISELVGKDQANKMMNEYLSAGFNKLNIGGGNKSLNGYVNIDFVQHKEVDCGIAFDLRDLSFIPDDSIVHVHSNHVVEHLQQEEFENQLEQYRRILKPSGRISIRCPNVLGVCYGFFIDSKTEIDTQTFLDLGYPEDDVIDGFNDYWFHKDLYGLFHWLWAQPGNITNQHLNLLTPSKIQNTIISNGFKILESAPPEASNIIIIAESI